MKHEMEAIFACDNESIISFDRLLDIIRMLHHDLLELIQNFILEEVIGQIDISTLIQSLLPMGVTKLVSSTGVDRQP